MARQTYRKVPNVRTLKARLRRIIRNVQFRRVPSSYRLPSPFAAKLETLSQSGIFDDVDDLASEFRSSGWNLDRALEALQIELVPFRWQTINGHTQINGYAIGREIAVSPLAPDPQSTCLHEIGHVLLDHTTTSAHSAEPGPTSDEIDIRECEAEAVAWVCTQALKFPTTAQHVNYILSHGLDHGPDLFSDERVRRIRATAKRILDAGWIGPTEVQQ